MRSNTAVLLRRAEEMARGFSLQHDDILADEALLRAAIAMVQYSQKAHLAAVEHVKDCPKDRRFLEMTRKRLIRAENHLRLRLIASVARKCQVLKDERLLKTADLALALLQ